MVCKHFGGNNGPCPICGRSFNSDGKKRTQCRELDSGWVICHSEKSVGDRRDGYACASVSSTDEGCWRPDDARAGPRGTPRPAPADAAKTKPPKPARLARSGGTPFGRLMSWSARLCEDARSFLVSSLGLRESVVDAYSEVTFDGTTTYTQPFFTIREYGYLADGSWGVVFVQTRDQEGTKKGHGNPDAEVKRGLIWSPDWCLDPSKPLFFVEGPTCTLSVRGEGGNCIGSPNNTGGGETLGRAIRDAIAAGTCPADLTVYVVGENDEKENGDWPGRTGAIKRAKDFVRETGMEGKVVFPPAGVKDSRELISTIRASGVVDGEVLETYLRELRRGELGVMTVRPEDVPPPPVRVANDAEFDFSPEILAAFSRSLARKRAERQAAEEARKAEAARLAEEQEQARRAAMQTERQRREEEERAGGGRCDAHVLTWQSQRDQEDARRYESALAEQQAADRRDQQRFRCNCLKTDLQRHKATFQPRAIFIRCEKWGGKRVCDGCRRYLIARETRNAAFRFGSADSLYEFGCTKKQYDTMTKRMRRAGADYHTVCEGEGWYFVCSQRIGGSIPVSAEQALCTFEGLLGEYRGDYRPVRTSHGWKLPRGEVAPSSYENLCMLPAGTTVGQIAEVASRFGASPRLHLAPRPGESAVQQTADIVRAEPWTEQDSTNFAISCMADLGGYSSRPEYASAEEAFAASSA
jgi:hypothetical protein